MLLLLFTGYSVPVRRRVVILPPNPTIEIDEAECVLAIVTLLSATAHGAPKIDRQLIDDEQA